VRALVHRWLQEQGDKEGEAVAEREGSEQRWQPGLFSEGEAPLVTTESPPRDDEVRVLHHMTPPQKPPILYARTALLISA
jgi:hypothetical protein